MHTDISATSLAPLLVCIIATLFIAKPGRRPGALLKTAECASLAALGLAAFGAGQVLMNGPIDMKSGTGIFALVLRLDVISASMSLLVSFIGWIVLRYSRFYLDGETHEGAFHGWMLATLSAVLILVQAGSLGVLVLSFAAIGYGVRKLLLFYPERPAARRAAAKFALVWGVGDLAIVLAAVLLWVAFGTADLADITAAAADGLPLIAHVAVAFLVFGTALKTATMPVHGWLTEAMEAPTPVSALLHAGIINGGGFLLIRVAELVQASTAAMATLVVLGGATALFGAIVMLAQNAVKTALAWSTIGQMGFMLMQCGLGLWALALLHIVAHSLYKAHAFLASGGAVAAIAASRRPGVVAVPDFTAVARAFVVALALYVAVAAGFVALAGPKSAQAMALGVILIFGVAYLVAQGLADAAPAALTRRTALASAGATVAYFGFQLAAGALWGPYLPAAPVPDPLEWALIVLALVSFGVVAVAQALFPLWAHHPAAAGFRVHVANGFYLNSAFDRAIDGYRADARD